MTTTVHTYFTEESIPRGLFESFSPIASDTGWVLVEEDQTSPLTCAGIRLYAAPVGHYQPLGEDGYVILQTGSVAYHAGDFKGEYDYPREALMEAEPGDLVMEMPGGGYEIFPKGQPVGVYVRSRFVRFPEETLRELARVRIPEASCTACSSTDSRGKCPCFDLWLDSAESELEPIFPRF